MGTPSDRRTCSRRCGAALVLALVSLAGAGPASAASDGGSVVAVRTSRGDVDLRLYAPAPAGAAGADTDRIGTGDPGPLVLLVSGEGGWRSFDVLLAGFFRAEGYWVGGVDVKQYFAKPQDDRDALARDMRSCVEAAARAAGWQPARAAEAPFVLAGYSFGADLAPWIAGAGGWRDRVLGLVMLGPDETGSLEFRISELLGFHPKDHVFPVAEALAGVAGTPVLLIHGEKDSDSAAPVLAAKAAEPKKLLIVEGADHHFSGHEQELQAALTRGLAWLRSPTGS